ncbi:MAG: hypothetical protein QM784_01345 [Polyangiaceae bacterium]
MRSSGEIAGLLGLVVQLAASTGFGQSEEPKSPKGFVSGESACPSAAEVERETLRLTPPHRHQLYADAIRVELRDFGESYLLRIFDPNLRTEKTYVDPSRDCTRRARFAAVFVVLTLMPPEVAMEPDEATLTKVPEAAPKQPPEQLSPKPAPTSRSMAKVARRRASLEAAAVLGWAPPIFDGPSILAPGILLRGTAYLGALGTYVAATYHPTTPFELQGISLHTRRRTVALGVSLNREVSHFTITGDVGAVLRDQRLRATDLVARETHSATEFGLRIGGQLAFSLGHVGWVTGVFLDGFPSPAALAVAPRGHLGTTEALDLNGYIGGRIGF